MKPLLRLMKTGHLKLGSEMDEAAVREQIRKEGRTITTARSVGTKLDEELLEMD